mmetsp:Transcript_11905/g.33625  ORF Transcript_11905/g.33625 Transcript_11905/m.33625 type:complete len:241 (+) Transcript_11905:1133-1855(+)
MLLDAIHKVLEGSPPEVAHKVFDPGRTSKFRKGGTKRCCQRLGDTRIDVVHVSELYEILEKDQDVKQLASRDGPVRSSINRGDRLPSRCRQRLLCRVRQELAAVLPVALLQHAWVEVVPSPLPDRNRHGEHETEACTADDRSLPELLNDPHRVCYAQTSGSCQQWHWHKNSGHRQEQSCVQDVEAQALPEHAHGGFATLHRRLAVLLQQLQALGVDDADPEAVARLIESRDARARQRDLC